MGFVIVSVPFVILLILACIGCYFLGRHKGIAEGRILAKAEVEAGLPAGVLPPGAIPQGPVIHPPPPLPPSPPPYTAFPSPPVPPHNGYMKQENGFRAV